MSKEYSYYQQAQFLGKHGVTLSCMEAMVVILTSAYRPEKITAVIGSFDDIRSERVLFFSIFKPFLLAR